MGSNEAREEGYVPLSAMDLHKEPKKLEGL